MRHIIYGLALCCLFLFSGCEDLGGKRVVYLAHTLPTSHPVHRGMEVFAESLRTRSAGAMDVKIFPDGQLGTEREVLELLQIGSIAMTKVSAATMANFAPEYRVLGVPYLFRDQEHMFDVLEGPTGKSILEAGSDYLLKGLCFYDAGSRSFYTVRKPVRTPEDLAGMKIRVMNHQMSVDMVNEMGASATPMAYGELYSALEQGVVDGAENNPPSFVTSRPLRDRQVLHPGRAQLHPRRPGDGHGILEDPRGTGAGVDHGSRPGLRRGTEGLLGRKRRGLYDPTRRRRGRDIQAGKIALRGECPGGADRVQ